MKRITDNTGRFAYRPFYTQDELDELCEAIVTQYMADHSSGFSLPIPTDRLTDLIEQHAELELYNDLSSEGDDVEGYTAFDAGKKPVVFIDTKISREGRQHRYRTTLAHEFGHVILHDGPFQEKTKTPSLFSAPDAATAKCKRENIMGAVSRDWFEWQAGYVCGALLMPKSHVLAATSKYCDKYRCHDRIVDGTGFPDQIAEYLGREFQVSRDAARYRINQLGLVRPKATNISLL